LPHHQRRRIVAFQKNSGRKRVKVSDEMFQKGMAKLKFMGREKTMMDQKRLYPDIYRLTVGYLFGEIWNRPHLSQRDRQLVTLATNVALARPTGSHNHYRSARRLGITHAEIMELIIQVGMYSGWACMSHAVRQYTEVIEQDGLSIETDGQKSKSKAVRRKSATQKSGSAKRPAKKSKR
jgi:4-carboxymuconolactone decarboxylase